MNDSFVRALFMISLMAWLSSPVWADRIVLTNGQSLEGLIARQTDREIVLQVALEGHVVLDRASIATIEPASDAQQQRLLEHWREEQRALKEREAREQEFETQQRANGLVRYRGQWVTEEELAAINARIRDAQAERQAREALEAKLKEETAARQQEAQARRQLEEELARLTQQLCELQDEHARLQQEIFWLHRLITNQRFSGPREHIDRHSPDQPMAGND